MISVRSTFAIALFVQQLGFSPLSTAQEILPHFDLSIPLADIKLGHLSKAVNDLTIQNITVNEVYNNTKHEIASLPAGEVKTQLKQELSLLRSQISTGAKKLPTLVFLDNVQKQISFFQDYECTVTRVGLINKKTEIKLTGPGMRFKNDNIHFGAYGDLESGPMLYRGLDIAAEWLGERGTPELRFRVVQYDAKNETVDVAITYSEDLVVDVRGDESTINTLMLERQNISLKNKGLSIKNENDSLELGCQTRQRK